MADMTSSATSFPDPWPAPRALHPLDAVVEVPGSKSLSNRYLVLAALGTRPVTLKGLLRSRDTELMMAALERLGAGCESLNGDGTTVRVTPPVHGAFHGNVTVNCGLAGTVMRFVPCLALFADGPVRFDGDEQAYARPMQPVLDGLEQLGACIEYHGERGFLPFTITPPLWDGEDSADSAGDSESRVAHVAIDSSASSQFISGLLLVASHLPYGCELVHTGEKLPSMPHIRMTMEDVNRAGGHIEMPQPGHWIVGPAELALPPEVVVEPDLSNAAPFLGAAMIAGGLVSVPRWPKKTAQPGGLLPALLQRMGASVSWDGKPWPAGSLVDSDSNGSNSTGFSDDAPAAATLCVIGTGVIHGLGQYDLSAAGEIAPSIAALCVLADAPTALVGIGHLRGHETNRLQALVTEIERIGGTARELADGIEITPVAKNQLQGTVIQTYADHRMATFAAMLGLVIDGIDIVNIATTRKTLPDFTGMWMGMLQAKG
jgi:3-phosphoshikimate 1-carboxyvinyltransferase